MSDTFSKNTRLIPGYAGIHKYPTELPLEHEAVFQLEKGSKKGKIHIQGVFTLDSKRTSKQAVLLLFQEAFKNVSGLTWKQLLLL